jgi:hypothetical protein
MILLNTAMVQAPDPSNTRRASHGPRYGDNASFRRSICRTEVAFQFSLPAAFWGWCKFAPSEQWSHTAESWISEGVYLDRPARIKPVDPREIEVKREREVVWDVVLTEVL